MCGTIARAYAPSVPAWYNDRRVRTQRCRKHSVNVWRPAPCRPMPNSPDAPTAGTTGLDIHCIAIGGTGMAPLACLLQALGHRVRGSDAPLYPPMSTLLADAGIVPRVGFDPQHLEPVPDLVIVGNAVPRSNPQAEQVEAMGLPRVSMPQAIARFLLVGRAPLVVAGTHGKTTTTALASWVYERLGEQPGFLIGGVPIGLERSFCLGRGRRFVIEGDEYNAAYFDRGAKFLHYRPQTLILTSAEYDHADLYPNHESLLAAFERLVASVPPSGAIIACGDAPHVRSLLAAARAEVITYGLGSSNRVCPLGAVETDARGSHLRLDDGRGATLALTVPIPGRHNVANALAVWAAARRDGLDPAAVVAALGSFRGVRRRLEVLAEHAGITVVDDFAHHPTAVAASLNGLAERFAGRRLIALFEPRSLTAGRALFLEAYVRAFAAAGGVILAPVFHRQRLGDQGLDLEQLAARLRTAGIEAVARAAGEDLLACALDRLVPGDVAVTMSSGAFGGLAARLVAALERSEAEDHAMPAAASRCSSTP